MRKILILLLMQMLMFGSASYGAVSEDMSVYVRKDIFEVYMQNINVKLDMILEEQKTQRDELKAQRKDINELARAVSVLSTRMDGLDSRLSARIDGLDARMGDLRNDIYLGLFILGIIIALPMVQKMLQAQADRREARKPYVTLEEVMRLIEENNAKVGKSPQ